MYIISPVRNQNFRYQLGNILILASFFILFFTYYPFIKLYFIPLTLAKNYDYSITIPKINAYAPVIPNVNPWKKQEYLKALSQGVAEAQDNPSFLFAHSSDLPWRMTRYNTAFLRLGELQNGDQIVIAKNGAKYTYEITGKIEVWPNQVQYLKQTQNQLILMTCTPVGTSLKRLLVFAKEI